MSTIYDRQMPKATPQPESLTQSEAVSPVQQEPVPQAIAAPAPSSPSPYKEAPTMDINTRLADVQRALSVVDDVVLKNYLTKLSDMSVLSLAGDWDLKDQLKDVVLFKVNRMVYEKDEYATEKFNSIISAMTYVSGSVFMVVDGHADHTDFYLGVKLGEESGKNVSYYADTLKSALQGQFPGVELSDMSVLEARHEYSAQEILMEKLCEEANAISICTGVPAIKNSKGEYTNATFVQGIEKFALAMSGKRYTALILATNLPDEEIATLRQGYENIYTQLSSASAQQLGYSTNESLANAISRSKGLSKTKGTTVSDSESRSESRSKTHTTQQSQAHTEGESEQNFWGKAAPFADPLLQAGAILVGTGVGAPIGGAMMVAGGIAGLGGIIGAKNKSKSDTVTEGTSDSETIGSSRTTSHSVSESNSTTESFTETNGQTSTIGQTKNFTLTVHDKHIEEILKRIDRQLDRLAAAESTGLWATSAYFLSYGNDRATAETGAAIYRSIVQGEQSGVEQSGIATWYGGTPDFEPLLHSVISFSHPVMSYQKPGLGIQMMLSPTNMLSSKEVAIALALPRKSVPGFPVVEHVSLGKEVVWMDKEENALNFELGCIFDQGVEKKHNSVMLDVNSLAQHTFITGSTGCGKSETVYKMIDGIRKAGAKFLIVEPAKGEYKNVFGTEHVYGTNPLLSDMLRINPFRFPKGIHVLEHVDRLIEIFNVCWSMYAAMPAMLKEAVLNTYENCGWDLALSVNECSEEIFPTFADLIAELEDVINKSEYSEEVKSNYKGSLITRVKSLANGINGKIFAGKEIGDETLFNENVIVDLSRIGSQETKSLIMGVLVMRLGEYLSCNQQEANRQLRHVTILEEAHNLFKRCSHEQNPESGNVAGKSVEMISNAIAEMRTYGEGFIIVDQSPGALDISAIRNTNTKIIMRLPEGNDRMVAGKSAAMKDNQVDEIAKLPTGVAVVYQNNWEEPVLCKINQYDGKRERYAFKAAAQPGPEASAIVVEVLKFLYQTRMAHPSKFNLEFIKEHIFDTSLPASVKKDVLMAVGEYEHQNGTTLWYDSEYKRLARITTELFDAKRKVSMLIQQVNNYDELTSGLKALIHNKVKSLPSEFDIPILQSLLQDYANGGEEDQKVYIGWREHILSHQRG